MKLILWLSHRVTILLNQLLGTLFKKVTLTLITTANQPSTAEKGDLPFEHPKDTSLHLTNTFSPLADNDQGNGNAPTVITHQIPSGPRTDQQDHSCKPDHNTDQKDIIQQ